MRLPLGPEFAEERERYAFRFCCEDCAYQDPAAQRCVHGWPDAEHRSSFYQEGASMELVFCKEFELA